ncbi:Cd(II)/Pb(II)-responsive transcriptional regulator [Rivibacter subsaxonicus]|uniref:Cd(II)/Pb(II)-responsive transcriptional regulator n=1 Tax=Rivibacter subsaxonicus TaxID=457575 RepID=A0A4Q7VWT4_9BURK|nr:Cd(II)/Pb(II)-responsive transcriptional regulator [Rivibacter subsaxonicus]RZU00908.1 Cd(II)/Pb(II)-responsive transcriptional regulator [Rivibacter subsaxonicus]
MRIGQLASVTGTPVETIRFYEREGLLPAPDRTEGNYRVYTAKHADRLVFIRNCRHLDMALDEVRVLLKFRDALQTDCGEVNALLDEHIEHVSRRIRELKVLEKEMKALRARCSMPHASAECGILQGLEHGDGAPGARGRAAPRHVRGSH